MQHYEKIVRNALRNDKAFEILIELLANPEARKCAYIGLKELEDARSVSYLIETAQESENEDLMFVLSHFDCTGYEKEIIQIALNDTEICKVHAYNVLEGIGRIKEKDQDILITSIQLQRELIFNNKVTDLVQIEFLEHAEYLIRHIPLYHSATILTFPKKIPVYS